MYGIMDACMHVCMHTCVYVYKGVVAEKTLDSSYSICFRVLPSKSCGRESQHGWLQLTTAKNILQAPCASIISARVSFGLSVCKSGLQKASKSQTLSPESKPPRRALARLVVVHQDVVRGRLLVALRSAGMDPEVRYYLYIMHICIYKAICISTNVEYKVYRYTHTDVHIHIHPFVQA